MSRIILASGSPRRKELLAREGLSFEISASHEEEIITKDDPEEVVQELAAQKAAAVSRRFDEDCIVIGADTVVACEGKILGKPKDENDAVRMISMLSGRAHQVCTGVCLIRKKNGSETEKIFCEASDVYVKSLTAQQILDYVAEGESLDKAGAYAIQGAFGKYIDHITGDYDNIVGLPVKRVIEEMKNL